MQDVENAMNSIRKIDTWTSIQYLLGRKEREEKIFQELQTIPEIIP